MDKGNIFTLFRICFQVLVFYYYKPTVLESHHRKSHKNPSPIVIISVEEYKILLGIHARKLRLGMCYRLLFVTPIFPILISGPVLDGVLYLEGMNEIVTFDLDTEVFVVIPFPSFVQKRMSECFGF